MREDLSKIAEEVRICRRCPLWKSRTKAVPGAGSAETKVMIIGEAPGKNEDLEGKPFVGSAGRNLDLLLEVASLKREEVFITNVVKCRPPLNRRPTKNEADACYQYLKRQIDSINPMVIVLLGDVALKRLLPNSNLSSVHGKSIKLQEIVLFPTYHPASIIYNPSLKEVLIEDFRNLGKMVNHFAY
jgi:DNA polymerase